MISVALNYAAPIKESSTCSIYADLFYHIALDYYNNKNDTEFKLVEDVDSKSYLSTNSSGIRIRCHFSAAEKDFSITYFSAQLQYAYSEGLTVTEILADKIVYQIAEEGEGVNSPDECPIPENDSLGPTGLTYCLSNFEFLLHGYAKGNQPRIGRIANCALDYYKKQTGANYKFLPEHDMQICPFTDSNGHWFHCSFHAEGRSSGQDTAESSIKHWFFAEIKYNYPNSGPVVNSCEKLTEGNITHACENCYLTVKHPALGDRAYRGDRATVQKDGDPKKDLFTTSADPDDHWICFESDEDSKYPIPEYESVAPTGPDTIPVDELELKYYLADRHFKIKSLAEFAINRYNNRKGANYQLTWDGAIQICSFTDSFGDWFHCSFHAKDLSSGQDSSINHLFFAEVKCNYLLSAPVVNYCEKLTEGNTTFACANCSSEVQHPASGDHEYRGDRATIQKDRHSEKELYPFEDWESFHMYRDIKRASEADRICALLSVNIALDYYNNINGSKFKLVEDDPFISYPYSGFAGIWIRCRFNAKEEFSVKPFSAELSYDRNLSSCAYPKGLTVTACMVLEDKKGG